MTSSPYHRLRRIVGPFIAATMWIGASLVAQPARQQFDVAADLAERSLKNLSTQSGIDVVFSTEVAAGIRTNAVKGEFSVLEVALRMVAGTDLTVAQNAGGTIIVSRRPAVAPEKNAPRAAPATASGDRPASPREIPADSIVELSPFEVVADTRGYHATNTMSGTRLNSKLEDLASSISVVTKEQMADFAMLDINDVFLYGANTEGTGTFTDFIVDSAQGTIGDNVAGDPANANRIRGIGNANVSNGSFETSNRVPIDPIDTDGVEISRGPNANIFGLGNASGTVNLIGAAAQLRKDRSQIGFRADSSDGWRTSFDLNRVLRPGQLALRVTGVRQRDGFDLKPSGVDTMRYSGMLQFRPFKRTTIKGSYQSYRAEGNRPNALPPQDAITDWRDAGSPTWDPLTNAMKINGVVVRTGTPGYLYSHAAQTNQMFIDRGGLAYWTANFGSSATQPYAALQTDRKIVITRATVNDAQPLIGRRVEMVTDKGVYDWSRINLNAPNRFKDETETAQLTIDQVIFDSSRQQLAAQLGWFHEDSERYQRYLMGDGQPAGPSGQLGIDVNERLLDGSPNPYFMRPALAMNAPQVRRMPLRTDTYRGQFAYQVNFTGDTGLRRFLGRHNLVGYGEYKERVERNFRFRPGIVSEHAWTRSNPADPKTDLRLGNPPHPLAGGFQRFYVGDNQGLNVDYEPGNWAYGDYTYVWGNPASGSLNREPIKFGDAAFVGGSGGTRTIQKTGGLTLQSALWGGRIIPTFGMRKDTHYTKFANASRVIVGGGVVDYDYDFVNHWAPGDWRLREGRTKQRGVVAKPFRGFTLFDRQAESGAAPVRFLAQALRGLSVHYNRSDSFKPAAPAQNLLGEWLPDPGGRGKDYGFSLNLFDGKLVVRANKYETMQINSRNGTSTALAKILFNMDYLSTAFGLQQEATRWLNAAAAASGQTLTTAALNAELARVMGVPARDFATVNAIPVADTDDIVGRGHELEIHFNPTNYWTLTANATEQQTINSRMSPVSSVYAEQRLPTWTTVKDPSISPAVDPAQLWWNHLYGGTETPAVYFRRTFTTPLRTAKATEGLTRPQIRRYRGTLSTNLRLSGLASHQLLRRFNLGGALRYESQGAIGYYGVQQLPAIITDYDYQKPIWDKAHFYADAFVGYRTRLWANKVGATFQLNVRNLQESGHLQPIAAHPDGTPYAYRIVSPRQFILSATFDL